jgi:hypothetical protein
MVEFHIPPDLTETLAYATSKSSHLVGGVLPEPCYAIFLTYVN